MNKKWTNGWQDFMVRITSRTHGSVIERPELTTGSGASLMESCSTPISKAQSSSKQNGGTRRQPTGPLNSSIAK